MGIGVSPAVSDPDVESRPTLLYGAGREDHLHYGGGYILFDWAPFSGNTPTDGAGITCEHVINDLGLEVLFEGELHVGLRCEHRGDRFSSASLCSSNDCEGVWVPCESVDQWWSAEGYGEGTGWGSLFLGVDNACQDGREAGQMSVYRHRGLCLWVHLGGLVFGEGVLCCTLGFYWVLLGCESRD
jgi:hypothetical protein